MAQVADNLGDYFSSFNKPLSVAVISKLTKWPNLQTLGHDANLKDVGRNFHGLSDAKAELQKHDMANPMVLGSAWNAIKPIIGNNAEISKQMIDTSNLGKVGKSVLQYPSMGAVFAVSPDELKHSS